MTRLKDSIDWEKAYVYCRDVFPQLESLLQGDFSELELQIDSNFVLVNYPPSIILGFGLKQTFEGKCFDISQLNEYQKKELNKKSKDILFSLSNAATQFNLNISRGTQTPVSQLNAPQGYVFKPYYQDFRK